MKNFIYKKVFTLEEAYALLSQYQDKGKILAGGTDLLVKMKQKQLQPEVLIDIKGIQGMDFISHDQKDGLLIGSLTSIRNIELSNVVQEKCNVISESASHLGSVQIRNLATLGGNLCNASPSAEMAPCLISLGAKVRIVGKEGERWGLLEEFFKGPGETILRSDELLAYVQVPNILPRTGYVYMKHSMRKAMDLAIVSVAVALTLDASKEKCEETKIVLGAVAPIPMRTRGAEDRLRGQKVDEKAIEEASRLASEESRPITDMRSSAEYRREMIKVLIAKSIKKALEKI